MTNEQSSNPNSQIDTSSELRDLIQITAEEIYDVRTETLTLEKIND